MRSRIVPVAFAVLSVARSLPAQSAPRLTLVRTLGSTAPEFGRLEMLAVGTDGEVVAVDGANYRLYRFRPDGSLRDSLSGKGSGPGEFRAAAGIAIGPKGEVALADIMNRRLTIWNADGKVAGTAAITDGTPLRLAEWRSSPVVVTTDFVKTLRYISLGLDGVARRIGEVPVGLGAELAAGNVGCDLCADLFLSNGHRLVAATQDSVYRLLEFDSTGHLVRRWQRPPERPRRRTDAEFADVNRRTTRSGTNPEGTPRSPDAERFRYPWRILRLGRDGKGRIWVEANHAVASHPVFDVFAPDGRFLGLVQTAEPVEGFAVAGDRLVAWGETSSGEPALWVYRITP